MSGKLGLAGHAVVAACVLAACSIAGAQSACADLGGTVGGDQTCHVHSQTPNYQLDMSFPADYPDQQPLKDYLTQQRDEFVGAVANSPDRGVPYQLDITGKAFRSGTPAAGTESLVLTVYSETGGAHPVTGYKAFCYDLGRRVPITLDTLFKPGTNAVQVLDPIVGGQLQQQWDGEVGQGGPAMDNILGAKVYQNFALTDDAVIFFIGQGQWLPEAAGPQHVSVPRAQLASVLA